MAELPASVGAKDLLTTHVGVSGWVLEINAMPKTPHRVIMISDTGGRDPNPKWLLDYPTLQIVVRGGVDDYLATFVEAKAVKDILLGITSQDINDDRWISVTMNGELGSIGRDENDRPLFAVNFALIIEPQVVGNSNRFAL